jgi:hypothetical protein
MKPHFVLVGKRFTSFACKCEFVYTYALLMLSAVYSLNSTSNFIDYVWELNLPFRLVIQLGVRCHKRKVTLWPWRRLSSLFWQVTVYTYIVFWIVLSLLILQLHCISLLCFVTSLQSSIYNFRISCSKLEEVLILWICEKKSSILWIHTKKSSNSVRSLDSKIL